MKSYPITKAVEVDLYQTCHEQMIPPKMRDFQCSQATYRKPLEYLGKPDNRLLCAGVRPFIDLELLQNPLTHSGIDWAKERFYQNFQINQEGNFVPYPFPEQTLRRVVDEFGGYYPIVLMAPWDGTAHYVGEPCCQVFTDVEGLGELTGWIESSLLRYLFKMSIVATRNRKRMDSYIEIFRKAYPKKTDEELRQMVKRHFHDMGRRAGECLMGVAHLYVWDGTDTGDAAAVAQYYLNNDQPFGACSIPAAAHRSITPWAFEIEAFAHTISKFGTGFISIVADSYSQTEGFRKLAGFCKIIKFSNGFLIGRPDSGDPVKAVLEGLHIFRDAFGIVEQSETEYQVMDHCGIIHTDGTNDDLLFNELYPAVMAAGFSPINVVAGAGQENHKARRSDTELAYKTCVVASKTHPEWKTYEPGYCMVMKIAENHFKRSIPCPVGMNALAKTNRIYPVSISDLKNGMCGDMVIQYDGRKNPVSKQECFTMTRERAWESWRTLESVIDDTFDPKIREMQARYIEGARS